MIDSDGSLRSIAVVIEPAKAAEIAPIIVQAYELTEREQEITQLIARGSTTADIAGDHFLSAHTVRDYIKAIFQKVGVSSRGELVAKLFAEHYWPLHFSGCRPGAPSNKPPQRAVGRVKSVSRWELDPQRWS